MVDVASIVLSHYLGVDSIISDQDFKNYLNIALSKRNPDDLQSVISDLVKNLGSITLVVNEANIALTITDQASEAKIEATKQALALLTTLSKEQNKVNMSQP